MNIPLVVSGVPVILTVRKLHTQIPVAFEIESVAPDFDHDSSGEIFALVGARGITRKVMESYEYWAKILSMLNAEEEKK